MLPFTTEQFLGVFAAYNTAIWPLQVFAELLGLCAVALLIWRRPWSDRLISSILAMFWLLMSVGYHLVFFAAINRAAYLFALLFVAQGLVFGIEGAWLGRIGYRAAAGAWQVVAAISMAYALVAYPVIGLIGSQPYPATPLFGVAPCPTTIFTLAILMIVQHRRPWLIAAVPLIWSLVGGSAALMLRVPQDTGLIVCGLLLVVAFARRPCQPGSSRRENQQLS